MGMYPEFSLMKQCGGCVPEVAEVEMGGTVACNGFANGIYYSCYRVAGFVMGPPKNLTLNLFIED